MFIRVEIKEDFSEPDKEMMNRILKQTHGFGSTYYDFDNMKYMSYWVIEQPDEENRLPSLVELVFNSGNLFSISEPEPFEQLKNEDILKFFTFDEN